MNLPSKAVAHWLFVGAAMVAIIVIIGGITRLTNSGLSIVEWKPISGVIPPMNEAEWTAEFENYKSYPEYQEKHLHFTLSDFKQIYFWEYLHRLFARTIGLVFIIPFFYFLFTKKLRHPKLRLHLLVIFLLGAFQGFLGWFMVSSGLVDKPRVSHFRLASHLLSALLLFSYILWIGMHVRFEKLPKTFEKQKHIRQPLIFFLVILVIQITYGAFVAGLDAGFFYPTWPKMGESWGPQNLDMIFVEEGVISMVQNPFIVQFVHRWIPVILLVLVGWILYRSEKNIDVGIPKIWIRVLTGVFLIQFILGILTIIMGVPVYMGVIHQFGAVILLAVTLVSLFLFSRRNIFGDSIPNDPVNLF
jgi:cytochrome c oxidase assembly protein subunit 15